MRRILRLTPIGYLGFGLGVFLLACSLLIFVNGSHDRGWREGHSTTLLLWGIFFIVGCLIYARRK